MVNTTCAVKDCKSSSFINKDLRFHQFPRTEERCKLWVEACRRPDLLERSIESLKHTYICSLHFENGMYGKKSLKKTAMPTLFLPTKKQDSPSTPSSDNEIKVFCPNCNTEVAHTAEGIREDQKKILVAKVYHYFEHEYEELKKLYGDLDLTPLSKFRQRTALATGVSETTVLQILKEEEERHADKRQEPTETRCRAPKRARQMDSSSEDDSSDDNVDDGAPSSFVQVALNEVEIETLVVKIEPPESHEEQAQTNPFSAEVKIEPPDDVVNNTNETLSLNEPADTKRKATKIPRKSDDTSTREHTQGESSATAAASSVRLKEELHESGLLGENEVKVEEIEIGEEVFS